MRQRLGEIVIATKSSVEFIDITDKVADVCTKSGIRDGLVCVFTRHTTTAVKINERCERLQEDMIRLLDNLVPKSNYRHDEDTVDSRANAHSHLKSLLLGASETVPLAGGKLSLGTWQSIFFVELDGPRKNRQVVVMVMGE